MRIQVKGFMSSPVVTAEGERNVDQIRDLMKRKGIHAIPIVEYSKQLPENNMSIRGIISSTDLTGDIDGKTAIEEIMTDIIHVVHKNSSAQAAAKMMIKHKVHHIVVMHEGEIVGMISSLDFVRLVAEHTLD